MMRFAWSVARFRSLSLSSRLFFYFFSLYRFSFLWLRSPPLVLFNKLFVQFDVVVSYDLLQSDCFGGNSCNIHLLLLLLLLPVVVCSLKMRNLLQPPLVGAIVLLDAVVKTPQTTLSHTQQIQMNIQFGNLGKIHMTMVYDLLSTIGNYFLYFRIYFNSFSALSRLYLFLTSSNIHVIFCS